MFAKFARFLLRSHRFWEGNRFTFYWQSVMHFFSKIYNKNYYSAIIITIFPTHTKYHNDNYTLFGIVWVNMAFKADFTLTFHTCKTNHGRFIFPNAGILSEFWLELRWTLVQNELCQTCGICLSLARSYYLEAIIWEVETQRGLVLLTKHNRPSDQPSCP